MKSRVLWLGIVLSFSLTALAQDTASITGTVTDPSGAAVSGAQVTLTSPDRGFNRTSHTNESGDFLFGRLPGGSDDLVVVGAGFKKYQAKGVKLAVGQKARADVALQVGAANTTVEVEGATSRRSKPSRPIFPAPSPERNQPARIERTQLHPAGDPGARRQQSDRAG